LSPTLIFAQETATSDTAKLVAPPAAAAQVQATQVEGESAEVISSLTVETMAFCVGVEEREPVGEGSEFATDVGTLFFWSNVLNAGDETTVDHIWYLNGEEKARVTLSAKYPRNRIWSSKIVPPEWDGEWKVDIVSESGEVLGAKTCAVK
ncbi:MAG: DUF2914 domain-containing protein, partial [candidate division Zixibacteria bacterium]